MKGTPAITIPEHARKQAIASIRQYFANEMTEEIGDLKASLVLDYFLAEIGPVVYNEAIAEAKAFIDERAADLSAVCHHKEFQYWPAAAKRKA